MYKSCLFGAMYLFFTSSVSANEPVLSYASKMSSFIKEFIISVESILLFFFLLFLCNDYEANLRILFHFVLVTNV